MQHFKQERLWLLLFIIRRFRTSQNNPVPAELQQAIDACTTMEQLLALLFITPNKNEAIMQAFDQRIEQLEKAA